MMTVPAPPRTAPSRDRIHIRHIPYIHTDRRHTVLTRRIQRVRLVRSQGTYLRPRTARSAEIYCRNGIRQMLRNRRGVICVRPFAGNVYITGARHNRVLKFPLAVLVVCGRGDSPSATTRLGWCSPASLWRARLTSGSRYWRSSRRTPVKQSDEAETLEKTQNLRRIASLLRAGRPEHRLPGRLSAR